MERNVEEVSRLPRPTPHAINCRTPLEGTSMKTGFAAALFCATAFTAALAAGAADPLAPIGGPQKPPPPPPKPVTETLFGQRVTDNYRYMEKLESETLAWMKAQGSYTRSVMDAIAPHAALAKRVAAFTGSFGFIQDYASYGSRQFYEARAPGADSFDLVVRDRKGKRKIVDIAAIRAAHGG